MMRRSAAEMRDLVIDPGSWRCWDESPRDTVADDDYVAELGRARATTGTDESVTTGQATVQGKQIALIFGEFGFMGGSIGVAAGERIVAAIRRATAARLPLVALPASGGTRMQEGTTAFLQMIRITAAVNQHKAAHLPYLVYLRHPTTGGVFASWASLGHITFAEPGALLGFLGPRVYESLYGESFPADVQVAENLFRNGLVDAVVPPQELSQLIARALSIISLPRTARIEPAGDDIGAPVPDDDGDAWESVVASRAAERPGVRELLEYAATESLALNGTGQGEKDPALLLALVRFGDVSCVLLGQDRRGQTTSTPLGPAALREARRGMKLAKDLQLPLVSVIDTPGAALSKAAEEGGLAGEIARCISDLIALDVPTVSVLLGQGTGGAAVALLPADAVIAAQHGWLSPLPPEGASAILFHDVTHAPEMAARQRINSGNLRKVGLVDVIVPEYPDAATEPDFFSVRVGAAIAAELRRLMALEDGLRCQLRMERFESIGIPSENATLG
ncbi:carboxyl transferase domain-containing protein [Rhodococcus sp. OK302]|uniref:carboxyl transferase domain-containing protein n=1 Tax=Rhodococcus sp. OK302 TaxID=1882769 RepID=UPI000B93DCFE|nr:carboxyl transferase domain-containing protein [Rhodococcus sp. OK302]OYD70383.1 acetyl-CoA carboxylase carboxyl transferase subunit beta [Rhodococcus sp. OK302]